MESHFVVNGFASSKRSGAARPALRTSKRARLVCCRCHEKKIRCDLADKAPQGVGDTGIGSQCSNCKDNGFLCRLRPSNRGKRRIYQDKADARQNTHAMEPEIEIALTPPDEDIGSQNAIFDHNFTATIPDNIHDLSPEELEYLNARPFEAISEEDGVPEASFGDGRTVLNAQRHHLLPRPKIASTQTSDSQGARRRTSFIGDTGYMPIFTTETPVSSTSEPSQLLPVDDIPAELQEAHLDTYSEYASTWCPILDRSSFESDAALQGSLLLRHALALCGNQINPPLLEHTSCDDHYDRAKKLFYNSKEENPIVSIMAILLFYWYSADPPTVVSLDTTAWWTGTAIRLAQQVGLHCDSLPNHVPLSSESAGLRRRIWWTLVARERITALSQGRPFLIDLDDCDVPMPTAEDFPEPESIRVRVFLKWIELCELIGRVGKMVRRQKRKGGDPGDALNLCHELQAWGQSLPPSLQPDITSARTTSFDRDVHGLLLTYCATVTLLSLRQDAHDLPRASIAAVVAASCTARIFKDYLVRGSVSFLAGQAGWYITTAILALLHARRFPEYAAHAESDIRTLRAALKALGTTWHSSRLFEQGVARLMDTSRGPHSQSPKTRPAGIREASDDLAAISGVRWQDYFPFVTAQTSPLLSAIMEQGDQQIQMFGEFGGTMDFATSLDQLLTTYTDMDLDFFAV